MVLPISELEDNTRLSAHTLILYKENVSRIEADNPLIVVGRFKSGTLLRAIRGPLSKLQSVAIHTKY